MLDFQDIYWFVVAYKILLEKGYLQINDENLHRNLYGLVVKGYLEAISFEQLINEASSKIYDTILKKDFITAEAEFKRLKEFSYHPEKYSEHTFYMLTEKGQVLINEHPELDLINNNYISNNMSDWTNILRRS